MGKDLVRRPCGLDSSAKSHAVGSIVPALRKLREERGTQSCGYVGEFKGWATHLSTEFFLLNRTAPSGNDGRAHVVQTSDGANNMMCKFNGLLLALFLCFLPAAAIAQSVNTIAITGLTTYGFASTYGDFGFVGPGLNLVQALPQGPDFIGSCTVGTLCSLSWSPGNGMAFCPCTGISNGNFGSNIAEYLSPTLVFTGSAFYSGGDSLTMNLTVSGTIYGYQLVGCSGGSGCSLGPEVFALKIRGTDTETLTMNDIGNNSTGIIGENGIFSGTATPVATTPEPGSLFLMTTGLAGVWMKRRSRS